MKTLQDIAERRKTLLKAYPDLAAQVAAIRANSVKNLGQLLTRGVDTLKDKGCHVYVAENAEEARKAIKNLLSGQDRIVRTHSNTLREISFDAALVEYGIRVLNSHIGEIISEFVHREPDSFSGRHPFLPYFSLSREEATGALRKFVNSKGDLDAQGLNDAAHRKIKEYILECEFGATGANGIAAENGTLIIAEDEGNCRSVSNLPCRHLAVAGIEKMAHSVEDSLKTLQCQCVYGLGKAAPTYYSLISGPSRTGDIEFRITFGMHGPEEVHVVILDNGRRSLVDQGLGDVLKCIDCGACFETIASLAGRNGWEGIPLTPKSIALAIVQGKLPRPQAELSLPPFTCPVEIDHLWLGRILPRIHTLSPLDAR